MSMYAFLLVLPLLLLFRTHPRFARAEQSLLALFLFAMPLVYLRAADWYALACAIIDVSLAGCAAGRVSVWKGAATG